MSEPAASLWLNQAESDLLAAERLFDPQDHRMFCQAIAKHQQVVEKAVKAVAAAVTASGIAPIKIAFNHEVEKIVSALVHLPHTGDSKDVYGRIRGLLHEGNRKEIRALCALAPRRPASEKIS